MAEMQDQPVEPAPSRRRAYRWAAVVVVVLVVALAGWALATLLDDGDDDAAQWEACAEEVDPPAARSDRLRELREAEDVEAARERLAEEIRTVERRIEAECGERP